MLHILVYCYGSSLVGFALKKPIKLAAIVFGFFRVDLAYLSYKGWVDVKWFAIENATPAAIGLIALPVAAAFAFMPRLVFAFLVIVQTPQSQ